ncbi:TIGR04053 family radical SAM/SPASM domain-containing protein [Streptomyces xinghaiensis]|uniref:TIGR04053 family radical SAM/SPASM domain-containing protein n=2 Tax=Streptomyces TaxID=1883 RepID=A0A3M8ETF0_9ACTN|nr:TIGR04053 family radical SAM/SPASM domain-containing protein [Streptomyces xinghaiensis]PQM19629.1 TIGR04053 family radical SAM/SPASM domain-containing protein [Streptomyces xinghaiensis]RKM90165.1 TIGR04053 family radical SAM/SPASM domain-containing protein [Streptomyces xinghaiensis]RNC68418.1 TIGR04053 family radical SAM/SPASM domain-containing protein [Streptomyces xinghaiensis]
MTDHGPAGGSAPGAAPAGGAGAAVAPAPGRAPARGPRALRRQHQNVAERPFIVIWESTRACPLACLHCRAEAVTRRNPGELDTEAAEELLRQVAAFGRPAPLFVITGGDPFQRPDLRHLVAYGTSLGVPMAVSPSGTPTLTPENLTALREAGCTGLSLSLDGSTAGLHDGFRGVPGVFRWTLDAWDTARSLGMKVQVNTTVNRGNLLDLPDVVALVREHGAMLWSAFFLVPTGRGRLLEALTPEEAEDVLNFVYDVGLTVPAKTTEAHHFRRVVLQRRVLERREADHVAVLGLGPLYEKLRDRSRELGLHTAVRNARRPPLDVNAGRGFVFVSHLGTVHPSGFLPLGAGSVRERDLATIYRESDLFTGLRDPDRLGGRCGACEFRRVCGGSRSRAYGVTGDPYAEEPWCGYRPGSFPYQEDLAELLPPAG